MAGFPEPCAFRGARVCLWKPGAAVEGWVSGTVRGFEAGRVFVETWRRRRGVALPSGGGFPEPCAFRGVRACLWKPGASIGGWVSENVRVFEAGRVLAETTRPRPGQLRAPTRPTTRPDPANYAPRPGQLRALTRPTTRPDPANHAPRPGQPRAPTRPTTRPVPANYAARPGQLRSPTRTSNAARPILTAPRGGYGE